jgi:hypothetical protein
MRRALLVFIALLAPSTRAIASPSARLVYSRSSDAGSCPDEEAMRRAVASRFGYDPFFPWAPRTVVVQVWRSASRYRARVQVVDEQGVARGTREISSDRDECAELFDATALAISIALDASAKSEPPPAAPLPAAPEPPPTQQSLPPPPTDRAPVEEPPLAPAPAPKPRPFGGVDVIGSAGTAPSPVIGGAAFFGVRVRALSLALEGRVDAPASTSPSQGQIATWLIAGNLVPCLHFGPGSACLLGSLGQLRAFASSGSSPSSGTALFAAAGARLGGELRLSDVLALRMHADFLVNIDPCIVRLGGNQVWPAPDVAGTLGAGLVVHFL